MDRPSKRVGMFHIVMGTRRNFCRKMKTRYTYDNYDICATQVLYFAYSIYNSIRTYLHIPLPDIHMYFRKARNLHIPLPDIHMYSRKDTNLSVTNKTHKQTNKTKPNKYLNHISLFFSVRFCTFRLFFFPKITVLS